ncbi:hypothetical protein PYCCODRAFT_1445431 [Trametes coccinea BRFM310]|uniref:Uncharacterized protein n=1 Tax=Trametes coccinea (strain BRFM310) TaxID=1353009 RepID=A0A1Y2IM03_TRAC3|nr:hypothetical protein PYCCODRAFT_1445431 [Trametes coccinea BRFM310]
MCHHTEPRSVEACLSGICSELEPWFLDVHAAHHPLIQARPRKPCVGTNPSYNDDLFLTILLTGFHAPMRLGKLVWPDHRDLQSYHKVTLHATVHISPSTYEFTFPSHKADLYFKGSPIVVCTASSAPDPTTFFTRYLRSCNQCFSLHTELWIRHSGHSMHVGGATSLQALGRWSTDTCVTYIHTLFSVPCLSTAARFMTSPLTLRTSGILLPPAFLPSHLSTYPFPISLAL